MYQAVVMHASFEAEKNRKALLYTTLIMGVLLLLAIFITWQHPLPPPPLTEQLIEVNLGNNDEGFGKEQPLIKGEMAPSDPVPQASVQAAANPEPAKEIQAEDTRDEEAAPVNKPVKNTPKVTPTPAPVPTPAPAPKPQRPRIAGYNGPRGGTGNGATEDNGYRYQGNNPNGTGDAGNPNGKPDSYGNNPGGARGGLLKVARGDRQIINNYIFSGTLPKATINAIIRVYPDGHGAFISFDKGSTSNDPAYATAIRGYLPNIQFNKSDHESVVMVPFNFRVQ